MPNFMNWYGRYFLLSDDPNLAAIEQSNVTNNCTPQSTDTQIITQIQASDASVAPTGTNVSSSDSGSGSDGGNTDEGLPLG